MRYCSVDCQLEHYQVVHKRHCKKLAAIMTHDHSNPLLKEALLEDTTYSLMKISQRILAKMRDDCHPAYSTMPQCGHLIELEEKLTNDGVSLGGLRLHSLETVWVVEPRYGELCKKFDFEAEKDPLGLWLTLNLIWRNGGMADGHIYVDMVN